MPEASLSAETSPHPQRGLWCLLAGALGLNWEQLGSADRCQGSGPHHRGSTAGSWAPGQPGRGRTAHRRSTPPGPKYCWDEPGGTVLDVTSEPQNLPDGPTQRTPHRPTQGTRALPHVQPPGAAPQQPSPHWFPVPRAASPCWEGSVGRQRGRVPITPPPLPALAHHGQVDWPW